MIFPILWVKHYLALKCGHQNDFPKSTDIQKPIEQIQRVSVIRKYCEIEGYDKNQIPPQPPLNVKITLDLSVSF